MKEKFLWLGIGLALVSWFGNYLFLQANQLEQPVFLDHYYQRAYEQEETHLTFYYLTNKQDPLDVNYAEIDGVEIYPLPNQELFMWTNNQQQIQYEKEFRHHYLKKVNLSFPTSRLPLDETKESWSFEQMNVTFTDGTTIAADIGNVELHSRIRGPQVFDFRSSTSSNQSLNSQTMVTTEAITVDELAIPFASEIAEDVAIKLDLDQNKLQELEILQQGGNVPSWFKNQHDDSWSDLPGITVQNNLFPLELEKGNWMQLFVHFNPERTSYFEFEINITGTTTTEEPFHTGTLIHDSPFIEQEDVDEIIEAKQGGSEN